MRTSGGMGGVIRRRSSTLLAAALLACGTHDTIGPGGELNVLFVGNSLTASNDLPTLVQRLGAADGLLIGVVDVSVGGYALEDHWGYPASRAALNDDVWDVVVLQQGPSSLPENRENLVTWAGVWADAIRARGATPALYMVWPERARFDVFDDVILSYRTAAQAANAELYAAGEAWLAAWDMDPSLPLYGVDQFHPSVMGSYLAALTIYRGLTGRAPPSLTSLGISAEDDAVLQAAAREVAAAAGAAQPVPH